MLHRDNLEYSGKTLNWEFRKLGFKCALCHLPCDFVKLIFFS